MKCSPHKTIDFEIIYDFEINNRMLKIYLLILGVALLGT